MKYIKSYEEIKLYKYIICDDIRTDGISIYEILNSNIKDLTLKIKHRYENGIEVQHIKDMIYYGNKYHGLNILYQTDDIVDAIEKIKLLSKANKYNI
jgi:hypothetical protein